MLRYDERNDEGLEGKHLIPRDVYLAGPFFTDDQRNALDHVEQLLAERKLSFFSPRLEMLYKRGMPRIVAQRCKFLNQFHCRKSRLVLACLSWQDTGTAWELAWADATGTPRLGFYGSRYSDIQFRETLERIPMNLMIRETCDALVPQSILPEVLDSIKRIILTPGYATSIDAYLDELEEQYAPPEINE